MKPSEQKEKSSQVVGVATDTNQGSEAVQKATQLSGPPSLETPSAIPHRTYDQEPDPKSLHRNGSSILTQFVQAPRRIWGAVFREGYPGYPDTDLKRSTFVTGNLFLHLHPVKVRRHALKFHYTFCLGGTAFLLFLILTLTGVTLMFYYHPSVPKAYYDMEDLKYVVNFGLLLRNLHRWSAHAMVAVVFLHMCRVFYTGSYKPPREMNWVYGVGLLLLTLMLSFTGYLLPWDQLAFWAITVGTNIANAAPILGPRLRFLLLGGNLVGPNALLRFYVLHCVVLPLVISVLMAIHFWKIRKDGGISGPL